MYMYTMRGSRNFHERGSNENGNFWSQTRGGPTPQKSRNYLFLGKIFKFQGGGGGSGPPLDPRMYTLNISSHSFSPGLQYELLPIRDLIAGNLQTVCAGTMWLV